MRSADGDDLVFERLAQGWAAISLSLLMFAITGLIYFAPHYLWAGPGIFLVLFVTIDSFQCGAFVRTIGRVKLLLVMCATLILILHFWKGMLLTALVIMGITLMVQRLGGLAG
jgi:hypothetical protein